MEMEKTARNENMVECHYNGTIIYVPVKVFLHVTMGMQYDHKKFIRYKEGAKIFSMSEREFNKLAHDAGAIYKRNKMVLVNTEILDRFMEYYRQ